MPPPHEELDPRVALAAERTLLAWIRTGIALMGFGFVISRFGLLVHELTNQGGVTPPPNGTSASVMGVALVGAGIVVNVWSSVRHVHMLRRLRSGERDVVNPRGPVAIGVACGVGGLVLIALLLSTLAR